MRSLLNQLNHLDSVSLAKVHKVIDDYENNRMMLSSRLKQLNPFNETSYQTIQSELLHFQKEFEKLSAENSRFESDLDRINIQLAILDQLKQENFKYGEALNHD